MILVTLFARIFINHENSILLKGKDRWECCLLTMAMRRSVSNRCNLLFQTAIQYALEFWSAGPPIDTVKIAIYRSGRRQKFNTQGFITGKRLGFQFNSDDVLISNPQETWLCIILRKYRNWLKPGIFLALLFSYSTAISSVSDRKRHFTENWALLILIS